MKPLWILVFFWLSISSFAQVKEVGVTRLKGSARQLFVINENQLLSVYEKEDAQHAHELILTLHDSDLAVIKTISLNKIKGHLMKVRVDEEAERIFVFYHLVSSPALPLGTTQLIGLNYNLKITSDCYFVPPGRPVYSIIDFFDTGDGYALAFGLYAKSSDYFWIQIHLQSGDVKPLRMGESGKNIFHHFNRSAFLQDNSVFMCYNYGYTPDDSTSLQGYSGRGNLKSEPAKIKLKKGKSINGVQMQRYSKNAYFIYGSYFEKDSVGRQIKGVYVLKMADGEVTKVMTKEIRSLDLAATNNFDQIGLLSQEESQRSKFPEEKKRRQISPNDLWGTDFHFERKDTCYYLTFGLEYDRTEGLVVLELDTLLNYKRHHVFPVFDYNNKVYAVSFWHKNNFNYVYFLGKKVSGFTIDANTLKATSFAHDPQSVYFKPGMSAWYKNDILVYYSTYQYGTTLEDDEFVIKKIRIGE